MVMIQSEFHTKQKSRSWHILTQLRQELICKIWGKFYQNCNYDTFEALRYPTKNRIIQRKMAF